MYNDAGTRDTAADPLTGLTVNYDYDRDDLMPTKTTTGVVGAGSDRYAYYGLQRLTGWTGPDNEQISCGYDGGTGIRTTTL